MISELSDMFEHPECPSWAQYLTVDSNLIGTWWEDEPAVGATGVFVSVGGAYKPIPDRRFTEDCSGLLIKRESR